MVRRKCSRKLWYVGMKCDDSRVLTTYHVSTAKTSGQTDLEQLNKHHSPPLSERNRYIRCLCCTCCLPVWARVIVWFIIVAIIIVIIVLTILLGTLSMPQMQFEGVTQTPNNRSDLTYNDEKISLNFGLIINIRNPNLLDIKLSNINVTAYLPTEDDTSSSSSPSSSTTNKSIGGGYQDELYVPNYSNFNFTFPFSIDYHPFKPGSDEIINELKEKCGLDGQEPQKINVDYTIQLAAKVLFVTIHPTISSSAAFDCPLSNVRILNKQTYRYIGEANMRLLGIVVGSEYPWDGRRFLVVRDLAK